MATYANTTLCSIDVVKTRCKSLVKLIPENDDAQRDVIIQDWLNTAKNTKIKDILKDELPKRFPTTADDLTTRFLGKRKRRYEQENFADHVAGGGSLVYAKGTWLDSVTGYVSEDPAWFFHDGVPSSSTYANSANNGAWLINTAEHAAATRLYINRGTLAVPNWAAWDNESLLDLMLNGSTALVEASLLWFKFLCYEDLANMRENVDRSQLEFYMTQRDYYQQEAIKETYRSIQNLGIDSSNDGSISDDERYSTEGEAGVFA